MLSTQNSDRLILPGCSFTQGMGRIDDAASLSSSNSQSGSSSPSTGQPVIGSAAPIIREIPASWPARALAPSASSARLPSPGDQLRLPGGHPAASVLTRLAAAAADPAPRPRAPLLPPPPKPAPGGGGGGVSTLDTPFGGAPAASTAARASEGGQGASTPPPGSAAVHGLRGLSLDVAPGVPAPVRVPTGSGRAGCGAAPALGVDGPEDVRSVMLAVAGGRSVGTVPLLPDLAAAVLPPGSLGRQPVLVSERMKEEFMCPVTQVLLHVAFRGLILVVG